MALGSTFLNQGGVKRPITSELTTQDKVNGGTSLTTPVASPPNTKPITPRPTTTPAPAPWSDGTPIYAQPGPGVREKDTQQQLIQQLTQGFNSALPFFETLYGPQLQGLLGLDSSLAGRIGFLQQNQGTQQNILNTQFGIDSQRLNLQQQLQNIARSGNNADAGTLQRQWQLALENNAWANRGFALNQDDIKRQLGTNDLLTNLAGQVYGLGQTQIGQQQTAATQDQMSNATARGAVTSRGNIQQLGRIEDTAANQRKQLEISRQQQRAALDEQRGGLISDQKRNEIARQVSDVNIRSDQETYKQNQGQIQRANQQLDVQGKALGLDKETLRNTLNQGLARLGVDTFLNVNDLMDQMMSNDLQKAGIAQQIFNNALEYGAQFGNTGPLTNNNASGPRIPRTGPDNGLAEKATLVKVGNMQVNSSIAPHIQTLLKSLPKVTLTSAYRDKDTNDSVNGKPNSRHLTGSAVDIRTRNLSPQDRASIKTWAKKAGGKLIDEGDHFHVQW